MLLLANGNKQWDKIIGDYREKIVGEINYLDIHFIPSLFIEQTSDKGYIIGAGTEGGPTNALLVKIDMNGNEEWNKILIGTGGSDYRIVSIKQTPDNGYIIGIRDGSTIIKMDINGNEQWKISYSCSCIINAVQPISDGYIIMGHKSIGNFPNLYIGKIDTIGNKLWEKTYDFGIPDKSKYATSMQQTVDNGYVISGYVMQDYGTYANRDVLLLKTDADGNELWRKIFNTMKIDGPSYIQALDNGYVVGTSTGWNTGHSDIILVKVDLNGNELWNKTFGGPYSEGIMYFDQTDDGYIFSVVEESKICGKFSRLIKLSNSATSDTPFSSLYI